MAQLRRRLHNTHTSIETESMELTKLIDGLADPSAYPFTVHHVELRQTHISAVFLTEQFVYKVKKPVDYGFLDFSTLEKRRYYCDEEVRLNRRLAADVYLGVVPITQVDGQPRFEGDGEPMEWAVKMRRLPDDATLAHRLAHVDVDSQPVDAQTMRRLGTRIALFHASAESGPHVDIYGHFDSVAGNARENFEQSQDQVGNTVSPAVFARLKSLTEAALERQRALIESRADRGVARDTHGDLRLDHVYIFPDRQPPQDLVVIDCVEFSERFRFSDPISDIAFLVMSLNLQGRRDLGRELLEAYIRAAGEESGMSLAAFYTAYRAVVRAKVEGLKLARAEIADADRQAALTLSRGSWLLAVGELETPQRRPCLLLVAGLPGTGKSTLAREVCKRADLHLIRSDVVRKELVGAVGEQSAETTSNAAGFGQGSYTAEWNRRTYAECLHRARQLLLEGERVVVDANFRVEADRRDFLDAATQLGVRSGMLVCQADSEIVRARLANRRGDASDADWSVYLRAAESWEAPSARTQAVVQTVDTSGGLAGSVAQAIAALQRWELWPPSPER